jgi:hypothetical protein
MLKITLISDGSYGERAYETIRQEFETTFIQLKHPISTFIDELDLNDVEIGQIEEADILITYTTHPDITLELVNRFSSRVKWIIVAAWNGEGFKNQLENYDNVLCPYIMCELEEIGEPDFDMFTSRIGKPEIALILNKDNIEDVKVLRTSPCGSTYFVADFLREKYKNQPVNLQKLPREAGLKLQNYPCRAPKIRLFSSEECKKDRASEIHCRAFKKAINGLKK